jgi:4-amino-4-deoxy-L-arabinose transferase-like glycosyltransferase
MMNKFSLMNRPVVSAATILLITLIGILLRLYGINFGLPFLYDPDEPEFVNRAATLLASRDLNPHWFGHPGTTVIYLLAILYGFVYAGGFVIGVFENSRQFADIYYSNPTVFYITGRLFVAFFGVASIGLLYVIASRIFNKNTGLIAAAIFAINPLHVYLSKLIRTDVLMTFLVLLVFWCCLEIIKKGSWRNYLLAGFFTGLAVATKYPAVVISLVILMAYVLSCPRDSFSKLVASGGSSLVGAFVASPYLFLDYRQMLEDVLFEASPSHLGADGEGFIYNLVWYVQNPLFNSLTLIGMLLAASGIILCIRSKEKDKLLLIIFPLIFLISISLLNLRWTRWIVPVIPFLCIFIARAFYWIIGMVEQRLNSWIGNIAGFAILLALVTQPLKTSLVSAHEMAGNDTRTMAREWVLENIPSGSNLLVERYTPHLPVNSYTFFMVNGDKHLLQIDSAGVRNSVFTPEYTPIGKLSNLEEIQVNNIEYVLLSNFYDRYLNEKDRFPEYYAVSQKYEQLMAMGTKICEIKPVPGKVRGPIIRIFKIGGKNDS